MKIQEELSLTVAAMQATRRTAKWLGIVLLQDGQVEDASEQTSIQAGMDSTIRELSIAPL